MSELDDLIAAIEADDLDNDDQVRDAFRPYGVPYLADLACRVFAADSGDLNASLALHETLLPGWRWGRLVTHDVMMVSRESGQYIAFSSEGPCPARALLLAILRAYRSTL